MLHQTDRRPLNGEESAQTFANEAKAVLQAMKLVCKNKLETIIITNSLPVLKAIENHSTSNWRINKLRNTIVIWYGRYGVKTFWLASHVGLLGNEQTDQETKSRIRRTHTHATHHSMLQMSSWRAILTIKHLVWWLPENFAFIRRIAFETTNPVDIRKSTTERNINLLYITLLELPDSISKIVLHFLTFNLSLYFINNLFFAFYTLCHLSTTSIYIKKRTRDRFIDVSMYRSIEKVFLSLFVCLFAFFFLRSIYSSELPLSTSSHMKPYFEDSFYE